MKVLLVFILVCFWLTAFMINDLHHRLIVQDLRLDALAKLQERTQGVLESHTEDLRLMKVKKTGYRNVQFPALIHDEKDL